MSEQRARAVLAHILEDLEDIKSFINDMSREQFEASALVKKAVCMSLINIGELSRELPDSIKERHRHIPWGSIVGLRNRAAHGYRALDPEVIWTIAKYELNSLEEVARSELSSTSNIET